MAVDICTDHVWVLLVVVSSCRLRESFNVLRVIPDVVRHECLIAPKHIFTPEIGMWTGCVHGNVRLEMLLNVSFILFEGEFDVLLLCIRCRNPIEVPSDLVLLIVESLVICATNCENMLGQKLADHAPIIQ